MIHYAISISLLLICASPVDYHKQDCSILLTNKEQIICELDNLDKDIDESIEIIDKELERL